MGCVVSAEDGGSKQEPSFHPVSSSYVEKRKGYPETLTAAERAAMAEVRSELAAAGIVGARWDDDDEMCRWLRARKFDVAATKLMITNHVKWEKDYDVDLVYKTFAHRDPEAVKAAYPRTYHRTDRIGRPINIDRVGRLNIKRINELTNNDEMEKEKIQDMVRRRESAKVLRVRHGFLSLENPFAHTTGCRPHSLPPNRSTRCACAIPHARKRLAARSTSRW